MAPLKPFWDAQTFGVVHAVGMAAAEPLALRRDGGDGARRARQLAAHRLDRPRARRCANRARRSRATQMGSNTAASLVPRDRARSSRCASSTPSAWTARGTTRAARPVGRGAARLARRRAGRAERPPASTALDALAHDRRPAGRRLRPGERRRVSRRGPRRRAQRRRAADQGRTSGCRSPPSTTATGTCTSDMGAVDDGWMFDHLTELSGALAAFATDLGHRDERTSRS